MNAPVQFTDNLGPELGVCKHGAGVVVGAALGDANEDITEQPLSVPEHSLKELPKCVMVRVTGATWTLHRD